MTTADERLEALFLPDLCGIGALFMVVIIGELLAIVLTLAGVGAHADVFGELGLISLFTQMIALSCAASLCLARGPLSRLREPAAVVVSYALVLLVVYLVCELAWWRFSPFAGGGSLISVGRGELLIRTMGISAIVAAIILRYFYLQHHSERRTVSEAEARLEALQARIRPHFLFNCMNTIASLTRTDPVAAERAVEDLADLFRANLLDARGLVTVAEDIELARRYLSIETLRLGPRLAASWDVDTLPQDALVPILTLQPLLENAIYHGIEPLPDGGAIAIVGKRDGRYLKISVVNPVTDQTSPHHAGNQLAQENVRQRIAAHYGPSGRFEIEATDDRYSVTLTLPILDRADAYSDY